MTTNHQVTPELCIKVKKRLGCQNNTKQKQEDRYENNLGES